MERRMFNVVVFLLFTLMVIIQLIFGYLFSTSVQLLNMPTAGSRNLVKHLNQDEEQSKCFSTSIFRSFLFPFLFFFLPQVLTDKMA